MFYNCIRSFYTQELLLAAQWAKKHKVPFPPIDTTVFDREGMKELYIFKDPNDSHCPVVLHFCLVNIEFRKFSKPGTRNITIIKIKLIEGLQPECRNCI